MAESLRKAEIGYSPTRIRAQGEDASIPPSTQQTAQGWEAAGIRLSPEQRRARSARSVAIALALGAFVVVIFAVTIVRLGSGALMRPIYMQPVQPPQSVQETK